MSRECKEFYDNVYQEGHVSAYGDVDALADRNTRLWQRTQHWLNVTGLVNRTNASILEIGCGMAGLADIHPGWAGAEYSRTAVERVKSLGGSGINIFEADAQKLPCSDKSYDAVFTWAALEHVPNPERAFKEIHRVLKGGGFALIAPAWNCRSWTVVKLVERSYTDLSFAERISKVMIPLRELLIVRALVALPLRLRGEVQLLLGKPMKLRFKALRPRWDLIEKYGHTSDDDAVADIDPHAAICFFKSRGYEILSHRNLLARIMARHEPVQVRKGA